MSRDIFEIRPSGLVAADALSVIFDPQKVNAVFPSAH